GGERHRRPRRSAGPGRASRWKHPTPPEEKRGRSSRLPDGPGSHGPGWSRWSAARRTSGPNRNGRSRGAIVRPRPLVRGPKCNRERGPSGKKSVNPARRGRGRDGNGNAREGKGAGKDPRVGGTRPGPRSRSCHLGRGTGAGKRPVGSPNGRSD